MADKVMFILRSAPGAGKSTVAAHIKGATGQVFEADQYFETDAGYAFDIEKLGAAHLSCAARVKAAMEAEISPVVIANTNTRSRDVMAWREMAGECGYTSFVMIVENWHGGANVHAVPPEIVDKMKGQLLGSIKLTKEEENDGGRREGSAGVEGGAP